MRRYALDVAISAGTLVLGLAEVLGCPGYQLRGAWAAGVVVTAGALAFRRRAPLAVLVLVVALEVALAATEPPEDATFWFFAWLVATYAVGAHAALPRALAGLALVLVTFAVGAALDGQGVGDVIFVSVLFSGAWALGYLLERRSGEVAALQRRAAALESEREERARIAIAEERARIARELHDVVAHGVSTMVLQAGGVRRLLTEAQERERDALMSVEDTGRQALVEMRRMLGIMRRADGDDGLAPQPGLALLDELAKSMRAAGLAVQLLVDGEPVALPPGLDLSAYRIVQEALTNALKHAGPVSADVRIRYAPRALEIEVVDDGRGQPNGHEPGHGLVGMRERVALFGGQFDAGRRADGGYAVHAHLPL